MRACLCVCSYEETEYPALSEYNSLMNYLNDHPIHCILSQVGGQLEFHSEALSQTKQKYASGLLLLQILKKQPHPTVFREIIGSNKLEG